MLPSEQHRSSLDTSSTTAFGMSTMTIIADVIDDNSTSQQHLPVSTFRHNNKSPKRRTMARPLWPERRDPSESSHVTSTSTSSSCCAGGSSASSASTAVTAAADDDTSIVLLLPLHQALRDYSLDVLLTSNADSRAEMERNILQLITVDTACVYDETGHLPLHIACRSGVPLIIIERLVTVYPEALRLLTRHNKRPLLPLHIFCMHYAGTTNRERTKVLAYLLRSYPEATRIATTTTATAVVRDDGALPLHLLCHNYFCSVANLALVYKYYPDAIAIGTKKRKNLPLHIACEKKYMVREVVNHPSSSKKRSNGLVDDEPGSSSDEIIQFLVQKYPHSLTMVNSKGELPFHAAVRGYQSLKILRFLLQPYPNALTATDAHGRIPLHLAVSRHEPCRVTIRALLETDDRKEMTTAVDRDGKTPLDYANHHPESWVRELLYQYLPGTATNPTAPVEPVLSIEPVQTL